MEVSRYIRGSRLGAVATGAVAAAVMFLVAVLALALFFVLARDSHLDAARSDALRLAVAASRDARDASTLVRFLQRQPQIRQAFAIVPGADGWVYSLDPVGRAGEMARPDGTVALPRIDAGDPLGEAWRGRTSMVFPEPLVDRAGRAYLVAVAPVLNAAGETAALACVDFSLDRVAAILAKLRADLYTTALIAALLSLLGGTVVGWLMHRVEHERGLRVDVERKLDANVERYQAMLQASPDLMFLIDPSGVFLDVHAPKPEKLMLPPSQFLGRTVADVMPPNIATLHHAAVARLLERGGAETIEYEAPGPKPRRRFESRLVRCGGNILAIVRDITDAHEAREMLRAREELYRITAERIGTVFYDYDVPTGAIRWAGAIQRVFGSTPEEFSRVDVTAWMARIHEEDRDEAARLLDDARDRRAEYQVEYRFRHADGRWVPVEDHGVFVADDDGRFLRMVGTMTDISARKTMEAQIERINECLMSLGPDTEENVRRIVMLCGELLEAESALYNRVGTTEFQTATGWPGPAEGSEPGAAGGHVCTDLVRSTSDFICIEDLTLTPYAETDPGVRANRYAGYMGHVVRRGSERVGSLCVLFLKPYKPRAGEVKILGILAAALSAEELRRHAEEALAKVQDRYGFLVRGSSDIAAIANAAATLTYVSPAAARITGFAPQELLRPLAVGIHPEDVGDVRRHWEELLAAPGGSVTLRYRFAAHDGTYIWLEATARNLLSNPTVEGVVLNIRDVTDQQRLADNLLQSQKLETVGRLAGGVAHDFNNLLQVINGTVELLSASESDAKRREELDAIREAGQRAAALTRQLLALSRRQTRQPVALDLNGLVREMSDMIRRVVGERVAVEIDLRAPVLVVQADRSQIEQVILNLVVNARDAMPEGGTVRLLTRIEVVSDADAAQFGIAPGEHAVLRVRDSGTGLSAEAREHLFEPFFTTKGPGEGTGLGLATVYGIVKQSGGHILAEPESGTGAEFVVYLPLGSEGVGADDAKAVAPLSRGRETVLIAEDEDKVRSLLARILRSGGYTVHEAPGGREALARLRELGGRVDLLVSDVIMPGINGPDLALTAKAEFPDLRVLFISGYAEGAMALQGQVDSGIPFLAKPVTRDALLNKVRDVLAG